MSHSASELARDLERIDGRSYPAYKDLQRRAYPLGADRLTFEHVQGDPFAAPSRIRIDIPAGVARLPAWATANADARRATADFLHRAILRADGHRLGQFHPLLPVERRHPPDELAAGLEKERAVRAEPAQVQASVARRLVLRPDLQPADVECQPDEIGAVAAGCRSLPYGQGGRPRRRHASDLPGIPRAADTSDRPGIMAQRPLRCQALWSVGSADPGGRGAPLSNGS